jgi:hypothetical protein
MTLIQLPLRFMSPWTKSWSACLTLRFCKSTTVTLPWTLVRLSLSCLLITRTSLNLTWARTLSLVLQLNFWQMDWWELSNWRCLRWMTLAVRRKSQLWFTIWLSLHKLSMLTSQDAKSILSTKLSLFSNWLVFLAQLNHWSSKTLVP